MPANSENARLAEYERLKAEGLKPGDIAKRMGVSPRTVKRYNAQLREQGRHTKAEIADSVVRDEVLRDELLERHLNTQKQIEWAINTLRDSIENLKEHVEIEVENGNLDGVLLSSYFKAFDSFTNQLTYLSKLLGEISDAPQLSVIQIDTDVARIIQMLTEHSACENCGHDTQIARKLYSEIVGASPRRAKRMPEFIHLQEGAIEGAARLLESGNE